MNNEVLIVNDNFYFQQAYKGCFNQLNLQSDFAVDGIEAIEKFKRRQEENGESYKFIFIKFSLPKCCAPQTALAINEYLNRKAPEVIKPYFCCVLEG